MPGNLEDYFRSIGAGSMTRDAQPSNGEAQTNTAYGGPYSPPDVPSVPQIPSTVGQGMAAREPMTPAQQAPAQVTRPMEQAPVRTFPIWQTDPNAARIYNDIKKFDPTFSPSPDATLEGLQAYLNQFSPPETPTLPSGSPVSNPNAAPYVPPVAPTPPVVPLPLYQTDPVARRLYDRIRQIDPSFNPPLNWTLADYQAAFTAAQAGTGQIQPVQTTSASTGPLPQFNGQGATVMPNVAPQTYNTDNIAGMGGTLPAPLPQTPQTPGGDLGAYFAAMDAQAKAEQAAQQMARPPTPPPVAPVQEFAPATLPPLNLPPVSTVAPPLDLRPNGPPAAPPGQPPAAGPPANLPSTIPPNTGTSGGFVNPVPIGGGGNGQGIGNGQGTNGMQQLMDQIAALQAQIHGLQNPQGDLQGKQAETKQTIESILGGLNSTARPDWDAMLKAAAMSAPQGRNPNYPFMYGQELPVRQTLALMQRSSPIVGLLSSLAQFSGRTPEEFWGDFAAALPTGSLAAPTRYM